METSYDLIVAYNATPLRESNKYKQLEPPKEVVCEEVWNTRKQKYAGHIYTANWWDARYLKLTCRQHNLPLETVQKLSNTLYQVACEKCVPIRNRKMGNFTVSIYDAKSSMEKHLQSFRGTYLAINYDIAKLVSKVTPYDITKDDMYAANLEQPILKCGTLNIVPVTLKDRPNRITPGNVKRKIKISESFVCDIRSYCNSIFSMFNTFADHDVHIYCDNYYQALESLNEECTRRDQRRMKNDEDKRQKRLKPTLTNFPLLSKEQPPPKPVASTKPIKEANKIKPASETNVSAIVGGSKPIPKDLGHWKRPSNPLQPKYEAGSPADDKPKQEEPSVPATSKSVERRQSISSSDSSTDTITVARLDRRDSKQSESSTSSSVKDLELIIQHLRNEVDVLKSSLAAMKNVANSKKPLSDVTCPPGPCELHRKYHKQDDKDVKIADAKVVSSKQVREDGHAKLRQDLPSAPTPKTRSRLRRHAIYYCKHCKQQRTLPGYCYICGKKTTVVDQSTGNEMESTLDFRNKAAELYYNICAQKDHQINDHLVDNITSTRNRITKAQYERLENYVLDTSTMRTYIKLELKDQVFTIDKFDDGFGKICGVHARPAVTAAAKERISKRNNKHVGAAKYSQMVKNVRDEMNSARLRLVEAQHANKTVAAASEKKIKKSIQKNKTFEAKAANKFDVLDADALLVKTPSEVFDYIKGVIAAGDKIKEISQPAIKEWSEWYDLESEVYSPQWVKDLKEKIDADNKSSNDDESTVPEPQPEEGPRSRTLADFIKVKPSKTTTKKKKLGKYDGKVINTTDIWDEPADVPATTSRDEAEDYDIMAIDMFDVKRHPHAQLDIDTGFGTTKLDVILDTGAMINIVREDSLPDYISKYKYKKSARIKSPAGNQDIEYAVRLVVLHHKRRFAPEFLVGNCNILGRNQCFELGYFTPSPDVKMPSNLLTTPQVDSPKPTTSREARQIEQERVYEAPTTSFIVDNGQQQVSQKAVSKDSDPSPNSKVIIDHAWSRGLDAQPGNQTIVVKQPTISATPQTSSVAVSPPVPSAPPRDDAASAYRLRFSYAEKSGTIKPKSYAYFLPFQQTKSNVLRSVCGRIVSRGLTNFKDNTISLFFLPVRVARHIGDVIQTSEIYSYLNRTFSHGHVKVCYNCVRGASTKGFYYAGCKCASPKFAYVPEDIITSNEQDIVDPEARLIDECIADQWAARLADWEDVGGDIDWSKEISGSDNVWDHMAYQTLDTVHWSQAKTLIGKAQKFRWYSFITAWFTDQSNATFQERMISREGIAVPSGIYNHVVQEIIGVQRATNIIARCKTSAEHYIENHKDMFSGFPPQALTVLKIVICYYAPADPTVLSLQHAVLNSSMVDNFKTASKIAKGYAKVRVPAPGVLGFLGFKQRATTPFLEQ